MSLNRKLTELLQALIMIVILLAILGVALILVLQSASKGRLARRLVLNESVGDNYEYLAVDDLNYFIGSEGVAITMLRPSGTADFSGIKLDVVSEGEFIPKGTAVIITKIEGHKIVVKRKLRGSAGRYIHPDRNAVEKGNSQQDNFAAD